MTQSEAQQSEAGAARQRSPMARKVRRLFVAVIAVMLLWTALWFGGTTWGARQLDRMIAEAGERGERITCTDRRIGGFPFQLDLKCAATGFENAARGVSVTLGASEAITLVYDPLHVIVGAAGPLRATAPGVALDANWTKLRSSIRVSTEHLRRLSLVLDNPALALRAEGRQEAVTARATHAEIHLGEENSKSDLLEVALRSQGLLLAAPGAPAIPEADIILSAGLPGAMPRADGSDPVAGWTAAGRRIVLHGLDLSLAGFRTVATGDLAFDEAGLLSGTVTLRLAGLEKLPDLAETVRPGSRDAVAQVAAGLAAFTKKVEEDGVVWQEATIAIDQGVARAGLIPLGTIPPVALP